MTAAYADLFLEGMDTVLHYDFSNTILIMMMMMMKTLKHSKNISMTIENKGEIYLK